MPAKTARPRSGTRPDPLRTRQRGRGGGATLRPLARSGLQSAGPHPQTSPRLRVQSTFVGGCDMTDPELLELNALCNALADGVISDAERSQLEKILLASEEA